MKQHVLVAFAAFGLIGTPLRSQVIDRTKPPELGPPPRVSLPPIVTRQLANGLKLLIVEQHELPLADFVLLVGSGGTADPAGKTGAANLTAAMLREGTTTRKSLDIADQASFLGISLFPQASWESSTLSLHTPTADRKSTRLNSSHRCISYAVFCLKKKKTTYITINKPPQYHSLTNLSTSSYIIVR